MSKVEKWKSEKIHHDTLTIQLCRVCDACCGETVKDLTESLHVGIAKSRSVFFVRESPSSECIEMDNVVHLVVKHLRLLHVDEASASSLFRILTTLKRSLGKHFGMAYLIKFINWGRSSRLGTESPSA